ncbi:hypothetical protein BURPS1710A_A3104 [Burkholderia pseudomallei 1710a]|uniref:Uncharacterized protein n=1 Tax=Burkholderia pseudomallei 1710a TaxID=320371 RepID=A0A0E1VTM6_BURPE|nr:hypothetical protein BURPS1710A_A3104 [Burkholderia pseudomallei 1710a]
MHNHTRAGRIRSASRRGPCPRAAASCLTPHAAAFAKQRMRFDPKNPRNAR